jgi:hypothetical protein
MNNDGATINVDTIEELAVHSLDRTAAGLDELEAESRACARLLRDSPKDGCCRFGDLADKIDGFGAFYRDIVSLFQIDPANLGDPAGNMCACEDGFRSMQAEMLQHLERRQMGQLADLLETELPEVLGRFRPLIPLLRGYIEREYMQEEPDARKQG